MERINNSIKELWDAVLAMNKQWMDAYSRGDAIGVGAFYTDDAQSLPPNREKGVESFVDIFFYLVFEISKLFLRYYYAHWFFSSYDSRIYL